MTRHNTFSKKMRRALLALMALGLALPACGHAAATHPGNAKFDQMDINKDGRVILEEFQAAFPNMNEQAFGMIDLNNDGAIEREEWLQFTEGHASGNMPRLRERGAPMNNIPGDPLIPPPDSSDLPLVRPPLP